MEEAAMSRHNPAKYKEWYVKNAEKKRSYSRQYYALNREAKVAYAKARREKYPRNWVKSYLKRLYGLDEVTYHRILKAQNNQCAICGVVFDSSSKALKPHIDHDHKSGKVRGLLCSGCNTSLGHVEREGFLAAALKYLGSR
jgi:hypothetical protein